MKVFYTFYIFFYGECKIYVEYHIKLNLVRYCEFFFFQLCFFFTIFAYLDFNS